MTAVHHDNEKGRLATQPVPAVFHQNQVRVAKRSDDDQEDDPFAHVPDDDLESLSGYPADSELDAALAKLLAHLRREGGFLALRIARFSKRG